MEENTGTSTEEEVLEVTGTEEVTEEVEEIEE